MGHPPPATPQQARPTRADHVLSWWAHHDLPRTAPLLQAAGVWDDSRWRSAGEAETRQRRTGYRLRLELAQYHARGAWFYGHLLDVPCELCLLNALRPGDTVLDGGGHVGMMSMLAAWRVGPAGRVLTFEPNPRTYERLRWHIETNRLDQVATFPFALSDRKGQTVLRVPTTGNTGAATVGELLPRQRGPNVVEHAVDLRVGDEVLGGLDLTDAPMFVKLDVEGHEVALLRGLRRTIEQRRPAILLECNPEMLPRNGASVAELFEFHLGLGYRPYALDAAWTRLGRRFDLRLRPAPGSWRPRRLVNVLFLHPAGEHARRLARYRVSRPA